jgi:hypothetical protein
MLRETIYRSTAIIVMVLVSGVAQANLVTNPGFESGATGWTFSDGNASDGRDVGTCESPCVIANTGTWAGFKNLFDGGVGTISQSIVTTIGTNYLVELFLADNTFETGTVTASFGSTLGVSVTGADTSTTYSGYSFTHTATNTLTDFVFGGTVTSGTFFIDDVSIEVVPPSAVPVPAAVWLFGTALIGFVGMSRRRKIA